jgi:hypothetical protein
MGVRVEVWLGQDDQADVVSDQHVAVTRPDLREALLAAERLAVAKVSGHGMMDEALASAQLAGAKLPSSGPYANTRPTKRDE